MLYLGIFDLTDKSPESEELSCLRKALSRNPDEDVKIIKRRGLTLATSLHPDHGDTFLLDSDESKVGLVFGRPYIEEQAEVDSTTAFHSVFDGEFEKLAHSRGSFCGISYNTADGVLRLFSDKVGIYPAYIARVGSRIYFSSALRMLQALPGVCTAFDPPSLLTNLAFSYSIGTASVYKGVTRIYGGQVLTFRRGTKSTEVHSYWSWDKVKPRIYDDQELQSEVYKTFLDAVSIRTQNTPGDLSFLSGGLDSRCIVGALRDIGRKVWSLNFAPEGCQDHLFGKLVAKAVGANHYELGLNTGSFTERQRLILESWKKSHPEDVNSGVMPYRVWSGDGGSVGLGHVYLDEKFIQLLRNEKIDEACDHFIAKGKNFAPLGIIQKEFKNIAEKNPKQSMKNELLSFNVTDRGKAGLLFLLMNDQRLHLSDYFENSDLNKFSIVLPFFDSKLLELVISAPLDTFLRHNFYNKWLLCFPPGVHQTPWQAYPGHEPCPISAEEYGPLRYQWGEDWFDAAERKRRFNAAISKWKSSISHPSLPTFLVKKEKLWVAYWLTKLKIRDYSYILNAARKISDLAPA